MGDKLRQRKALLKSAKGAADKVGGWGTSCGRGRRCLRVLRGQQTSWGGGRMGMKSGVRGSPNAPHAAMRPLHAAMRLCGPLPPDAPMCPIRPWSVLPAPQLVDPCGDPWAGQTLVHGSSRGHHSHACTLPLLPSCPNNRQYPPLLPVGWAVISRPLQPAAAPRRRRSRRQGQRDSADPCGAGAAGGEAGEEGEERCECVWGGPWEVGRSG